MIKSGLGRTTVAALVAAFALFVLLAFGTVIYWTTARSSTIQGWTEEDRVNWYARSQGSRLLPYKWFLALEQPGATGKFADETYLASFGHLAAPPGRKDRLPIGFAVDRQPDEDFVVTKLRWYADQRGDGQETAEPWLGLNCAACHTAELRYQGHSIRVDGGPGFSDLQSFSEALDRALVETRDDEARFRRFAGEVLAKDDERNRGLLRAALNSLVAWQQQARQLNDTPLRYGYARLDAFGQIFNKIQMFGGSAELKKNPANAPVSYPFLWGIHLETRVQWNGLAKKIQIPLGQTFDIGALGRNAAEALGVFAEVVVTRTDPSTPPGLFKGNGPAAGYVSSINVENLSMFEHLLTKLEPPKWPSAFPNIDQSKSDRGKKLFVAEHCVTCHGLPGTTPKPGETVEKMVSLAETAKKDAEDKTSNLTDIWMACNVFLRDGQTGKLEGTKTSYFSLRADPVLATVDSMANMLPVATRGALVGKVGEIAKTAVASFFGVPHWQGMMMMIEGGATPSPREKCTTTSAEIPGAEILAYKARPLDGIWATAPYLHNGSVPTLYHLLLPAKDRPKTFWIGSREYDPKYVGFIWDKKISNSDFEYRAVDTNGEPIDGNANVGHEYGASSLTDDDRWALVEYLKTL